MISQCLSFPYDPAVLESPHSFHETINFWIKENIFIMFLEAKNKYIFIIIDKQEQINILGDDI